MSSNPGVPSFLREAQRLCELSESLQYAVYSMVKRGYDEYDFMHQDFILDNCMRNALCNRDISSITLRQIIRRFEELLDGAEPIQIGDYTKSKAWYRSEERESFERGINRLMDLEMRLQEFAEEHPPLSKGGDS